jgi:hypothetical protein
METIFDHGTKLDEGLHLHERGIGPWGQQWHEAEDWYFQHAAPDRWFDIIVENQ